MRKFWFESNGVSLFAVEDGKGPVIVMLHGALADHQAALPYFAPLSPRYRMVAPDLRGSGKSHYGEDLTFDLFSRDIGALLDKLGVEQAFVAGISSGSGAALHFALQFPERTAGLVLLKPVYSGEEQGYTDQQKSTFEMMDSIASRAIKEGVQVLQQLYVNLPSGMREKALAMAEGFDAASVAATSRFVVSGRQPFTSAADLRSLKPPTLLVPGNDPLHPAEVSELYAANIPNCTAVHPSTDVTNAINDFCDLHITA